MRKAASNLMLAFFACAASPVFGDAADTSAPNESAQTPFTPFTGKVTRDKVRMRSQPGLDAPIVKELNKGDLLVILGESDDFYAVQPPTGTKAYIFRTFVLDNTIEGNHVNVRMEPNVDAPIIAQLNSGEHVQGAVSQQNSKWLEILPPSSTRFFVSKDYINNIGDQSLLGTLERRRQEADQLMGAAIAIGQKELQKPFDQINLDIPIQNFNKVIKDYADFPEKPIGQTPCWLILKQHICKRKSLIWKIDQSNPRICYPKQTPSRLNSRPNSSATASFSKKWKPRSRHRLRSLK